jgi:hypothetical protein
MLEAQSIYDADTVALMGRTFDDAWSETMATTLFPSTADETVTRIAMRQLIQSAITNGVRDPVRLKSIALGTWTTWKPA